MKKLNYKILWIVAIIAILSSLMIMKLHSQDKRFVAFGYTELADKNTHNESFDYGFNLGAGIEYQMTLMYFKAETYWFPDLNNIDYIDFKGTVGFNHHFGWGNRIRAYSGFKMGFIHRDWNGAHMLTGVEAGIEYCFNNGLVVGFQGYYEHKEDDKFTNSNATGHNVSSFGLKIGKEL